MELAAKKLSACSVSVPGPKTRIAKVNGPAIAFGSDTVPGMPNAVSFASGLPVLPALRRRLKRPKHGNELAKGEVSMSGSNVVEKPGFAPLTLNCVFHDHRVDGAIRHVEPDVADGGIGFTKDDWSRVLDPHG